MFKYSMPRSSSLSSDYSSINLILKLYPLSLLFEALIIVDVTVKSYTVPSKELSLVDTITVLP